MKVRVHEEDLLAFCVLPHTVTDSSSTEMVEMNKGHLVMKTHGITNELVTVFDGINFR